MRPGISHPSAKGMGCAGTRGRWLPNNNAGWHWTNGRRKKKKGKLATFDVSSRHDGGSPFLPPEHCPNYRPISDPAPGRFVLSLRSRVSYRLLFPSVGVMTWPSPPPPPPSEAPEITVTVTITAGRYGWTWPISRPRMAGRLLVIGPNPHKCRIRTKLDWHLD